MKINKMTTFATKMAELEVKGKFASNYVKTNIGDSTNNNRTVTVNQLIRFLARRNASKNQRELAGELKYYYGNIKDLLHFNRKMSNLVRTDAYDMSEFAQAFRQKTIWLKIEQELNKEVRKHSDNQAITGS